MNVAGVINSAQRNAGSGPSGEKRMTNGNSTFAKLLGNVTSERGKKEVTNTSIANKQNEVLSNKDQLQDVLQRIAGAIPFEEGFLTKEKLYDKDVQEFLQLLPQDLQLEIEDFFQGAFPIESLIQTADMMNQPANMLAYFIALSRSMSEYVAPSNQDITHFLKHIEQLLNTVERLSVIEIKDPKDIMRQFIQALQKEVQGPNQSQFLQSLMQRSGIGESRSDGSQGITLNADGQNMSRVQQMVIHIGEQPTKEAEQRQFVRQFQELLGRGVLKNLNNGSQISIKFFPEHLGRLDIRLSQINGVITARILASSSTARELIESQIQQLRHAFAQQQLSVERIEVAQQHQQTASNLNKDGQGRQADRDEREEQEDDNEANNETFSQVLEEITINEKV
ncbi:hypothetical protein BTR23_05335 [Alkalihalophilus pseudofirmus]|nr:hypothetical protein BTR23_05335 [Alkalihalophilus pseudofirmus]